MLQVDAIITLDAGRYRLRRRLGGSAYGELWRASGPLGEVALKLVNAEQMARAHPGQQGRWTDSARKEIAFLRSLAPWDERHIVRLLDSGEHAGLPVMALELLDGDLGACIAAEARTRQPSDIARALAWLAQINQALAKVHQYGWRYLDLKPANVLRDARTGKVKLADFGTTQACGEAAAASYAGTASWQAPEQFFPAADGTYRTDARTDYFALGAMFYYLVTGGTLPRFCRDCGDAYRDHQSEGAAILLERQAGTHFVTLHPDEAAHFAARFGDQAGVASREATWCPAASASVAGTGAAALVLLRALLAPSPADRPASALQISRMIGAIHAHAARPAQVFA